MPIIFLVSQILKEFLTKPRLLDLSTAEREYALENSHK